MSVEVTQLAGGRGWLNADAAASLARVDRAIGHLLQITEAGRTRAEQQAHYDRYMRYLRGGPWAPLAAVPGSSPHEFGNAIDTNERLVTLLAEHGWSRPLPSEPWHFVYNRNNDRHRYDPAPAGQEEDDMSQAQADQIIAVIQTEILDFLEGMNEKIDKTIVPSLERIGGDTSSLVEIRDNVRKLVERPGLTDEQVADISRLVVAAMTTEQVQLIANTTADVLAKRLID